MLLYHGTNTKRLPSIKKKGLITTAPKASKGEDFVYLTDKPEIAALFSGFGVDKQGMHHEGYMTPLEAKKQTGVVLKVNVDKKYLALDQIWGKKLKELKSPELYKKIYDEILDDLHKGNQVIEWHVEKETYKIWKEAGEEGEYDPNFVPPEDYDYAVDVVISGMAKKELKAMQDEAKEYMSGKLYQYSKPIPPKDIIEELPAKHFLKAKKESGKEFGNPLNVDDPFAVESFYQRVKAKYNVR